MSAMAENAAGWVGIIANPASGKDIRRLVSQATLVNNHEKVSIVCRVLLALHAGGVRRVEIMPDAFSIGARAFDALRDRPEVLAGASLIDMPQDDTADDSLRAARYLRQAGAGCIVVLGGDGTCRVVARGCGETPLLAVSTGTNNVVPAFVEGTVAGAAAAYVALHPGPARGPLPGCYRHKRLVLHVDGREADQALVDLVLLATDGPAFAGARAVWQAGWLRQVFVSRAAPTNIGMSAVIGMARPVDRDWPGGAMVSMMPGGRRVSVPLVPGAFVPVSIGPIVDMEPGVRYPVDDARPAVVALDGERELSLAPAQRAEVSLELDGPWIVDVERTLRRAVAEGAFLS